MLYSEALKEVLARVLDGRTVRASAERCQVSYDTLQDMRKHGKIPGRDTVTRIANGFGLAGRDREELFAVCGYIEISLPARQPASEAAG